jgi:hypothetical protein
MTLTPTRGAGLVHADALAVPLIAFRGLWDKFAGPCSLGAIRRSYLRGVPSLVRCGDGGLDLSDVLAFIVDPAVNRRQLPLYLITHGQPLATVAPLPDMPWLDVFAIDITAPADATSPIYRWRSGALSLIGCYVPVVAWRRGLAAEDFVADHQRIETILLESSDVIDDVAASSRLAHLDDAKAVASVRALVGAGIHGGSTQIVRVSDLVELDLLDRCIREAA